MMNNKDKTDRCPKCEGYNIYLDPVNSQVICSDCKLLFAKTSENEWYYWPVKKLDHNKNE